MTSPITSYGMWLNLIAVLGLILVAITVPWMAFQFALRQEDRWWVREQRARLYVDLLTEAFAEEQFFEYDIAGDVVRENMKTHFVDLRLPPRELARLGARGTAFGSRKVNAAFNRMQSAAARDSLVRPKRESDRIAAREAVSVAYEELQAAVRASSGADDKR